MEGFPYVAFGAEQIYLRIVVDEIRLILSTYIHVFRIGRNYRRGDARVAFDEQKKAQQDKVLFTSRSSDLPDYYLKTLVAWACQMLRN